MLFYNYFTSPLGGIELCVCIQGLPFVLFINTEKRTLTQQTITEHPILKQTEKELQGYFKKVLTEFSVLLAINGTEFQKRVWQQFIAIPFSSIINYLSLAKQLSDVKCIRAAATANGKNPISIIIPCHRVIGGNGSLVGYSGALQRKQ